MGHGVVEDIPGVPLAEVEVLEPVEGLLLDVLLELLEVEFPELVVEFMLPVVPGVEALPLVPFVDVLEGEVLLLVDGLVALVPGNGSQGAVPVGV